MHPRCKLHSLPGNECREILRLLKRCRYPKRTAESDLRDGHRLPASGAIISRDYFINRKLIMYSWDSGEKPATLFRFFRLCIFEDLP